jgi:hypothetical protein
MIDALGWLLSLVLLVEALFIVFLGIVGEDAD